MLNQSRSKNNFQNCKIESFREFDPSFLTKGTNKSVLLTTHKKSTRVCFNKHFCKIAKKLKSILWILFKRPFRLQWHDSVSGRVQINRFVYRPGHSRADPEGRKEGRKIVSMKFIAVYLNTLRGLCERRSVWWPKGFFMC